MRRLLVIVASVGLLALAGCGDDDGGESSSGKCLDGTSGEVTIVAKDIKWDADCIDAVADQPLLVKIDNQDKGVNHNFHVKDAPGKPTTELEPGPVVQELEVTAPAGEYTYVCDIHPNMVGKLVVAEAEAG